MLDFSRLRNELSMCSILASSANAKFDFRVCLRTKKINEFNEEKNDRDETGAICGR